jgi:recombination protein U
MVNYPNSKKAYQRKNVSHSNRGMSFETIINESNEYYRVHDKAIIHKKPIPIQIVKVAYPSRQKAVIKEAYYKVPSTTDYNGVYDGYHIDFEAKETRNKTSFPLKNIHVHQVEHMKDIDKQGGIAFIIVYFKRHDEVYVLSINTLLKYVKRARQGRKSITYEEFKENGYLVSFGFTPRLDYLKAVDHLIQSKTGE